MWLGAKVYVRQCLRRCFGNRGIPCGGCSPVGEDGVLRRLWIEPGRRVGWGGGGDVVPWIAAGSCADFFLLKRRARLDILYSWLDAGLCSSRMWAWFPAFSYRCGCHAAPRI